MHERDGQSRAGSDPLVGQLLQERYCVLRRIGKGGMGVVYQAEHVLLKKSVAIKVLGDDAASPAAVARFVREAQAAAAVGHDAVVQVTDMGTLESGGLFLVLEYLDGVELQFQVARNGPLPLRLALNLLLQLCEALEAVHAAGIVHRDLKPQNLFLVEQSGRKRLKVLDFGVCKLAGTDTSQAPYLTTTGAILGTPNYMSPEQVQGERTIDERADLYAVGAIGCFMLTGSPPFEAPSLLALFVAICNQTPRDMRLVRPEVPEALAAVLMRAMAKSPEDRFASCRELRKALSAVEAELLGAWHGAATTQSEVPPPPSPSEPLGGMKKRKKHTPSADAVPLGQLARLGQSPAADSAGYTPTIASGAGVRSSVGQPQAYQLAVPDTGIAQPRAVESGSVALADSSSDAVHALRRRLVGSRRRAWLRATLGLVATGALTLWSTGLGAPRGDLASNPERVGADPRLPVPAEAAAAPAASQGKAAEVRDDIGRSTSRQPTQAESSAPASAELLSAAHAQQEQVRRHTSHSLEQRPQQPGPASQTRRPAPAGHPAATPTPAVPEVTEQEVTAPVTESPDQGMHVTAVLPLESEHVLRLQVTGRSALGQSAQTADETVAQPYRPSDRQLKNVFY